MSVDTDAILAYGVPIPEDEWVDFDEDEDFNDEERLMGNRPGYLAYTGYYEDGVGVRDYCSGSYPMYFAHIEDTATVANRGETVEIKRLEVGEDWSKRIQDFCEKYGFHPEVEPGWYLMSCWGGA